MSNNQPPIPKRSLPVTWGTGARDPRTGRMKQEIQSTAQVIQEPTLQDIAAFTGENLTTCGSCAHFRPPNKDRPEVKGFLARAIHEAGWKLGYMGHSPENLSRCRENEQLLVGVHSKSCGHYSKGNGGLR